MTVEAEIDEPVAEQAVPIWIDVPDGRGIKNWAPAAEEGAMKQAQNLARLPFVHRHVALMPDAHQGYGMPIGGVLAAKRAIVPYAIGVDIGCGVVLYETDLEVSQLMVPHSGGQTILHMVLHQILRDVPVGNGPQAQYKEPQPAVELGERPDSVKIEWWDKAAPQLGSLGGGNHFIELQADDEDRVYLMLHSGSRALGKQICDSFHKRALSLNQLWYSKLPDRELAYLPMGTSGFTEYIEAMSWALRFAELNRQRMVDHAHAALKRYTSMNDFVRVADCHHNYAAMESHFGENVVVHRKGAVRARDGEDVLIPGSMGTFSYWAKGRGNPESFMTSPHGAGRAMSRAAARKAFDASAVKAELSAAQTMVVSPDAGAVIEEAPRAYKDIGEVMRNSADLVEIHKRLRPIGTVKG